MGNNFGKKQLNSLNQWVPADEPDDTLFPMINAHRTRLLFNQVTHDYIEEYMLHFASEEDLFTYTQQLEWRKFNNKNPLTQIPTSPPNFVHPVRYFINTSDSQLCNTSHSGSVYFDRVEMRLKEINDFPYLDSLYMMKTVLEGFKFLHEKFGVFEIKEELIFITREGQVKLWIHENLSKACLEENADHLSEKTMITTAIQLIEDNLDVDDRRIPSNQLFSDYLIEKVQNARKPYLPIHLYNLANITFKKVLTHFNTFIELNRQEVPTKMYSVYELFQSNRNVPAEERGEKYESAYPKSSNESRNSRSTEQNLYHGKNLFSITDSKIKRAKKDNVGLNRSHKYKSNYESKGFKNGRNSKIRESIIDHDSSELKITELNEEQKMYVQLYKTSRVGDEGRPKSSFNENLDSTKKLNQERERKADFSQTEYFHDKSLYKPKKLQEESKRLNTEESSNKLSDYISNQAHYHDKFETRVHRARPIDPYKAETKPNTPNIFLKKGNGEFSHQYYGAIPSQRLNPNQLRSVQERMCSADHRIIGNRFDHSSSKPQHVSEIHNQKLQPFQETKISENNFQKIRFKYQNYNNYVSPRLQKVSSKELHFVAPNIIKEKQSPKNEKMGRKNIGSEKKVNAYQVSKENFSKIKEDSTLIKYYTSNQSYELDAEIADDLEKILGVQHGQ